MRNPFSKIKLSQLHILYNTIAVANVRNVTIIKRKYLERGLSFDETFSLFKDLKILRVNGDQIMLSKTFSPSLDSIVDFKKKFISVLFSATGYISAEIRNFLLEFQTKDREIFFKATEFEKIKYSDIRNLLLELDFILIGYNNTTYFINPDFKVLFFKYFCKANLSPKTLKKRQAENELIGLKAEKAVIDYELKRLSVISVLPNEIKHISQENVLAGYDIKSFEDYLDSNSRRIDRFIEVKAVSIADYKFYWSRTEIEVAKVFGEMYYLYLLPVVSNKTFDFEKLVIKRNPFKSVYSNELEWNKEEESIYFTKIQTSSK